MSNKYLSFVTGTHSLYDRYYDDWQLCINSFYGGVEYKDAKYLRAYAIDTNTPSEAINTYVVNDDGSTVSKSRARVEVGYSENQVNRGQDMLSGSFYQEKLDNTPNYNYVKLIVSEYNSILFRNPPQRTLSESEEISIFEDDVDGEGNSINEFMSLVDMFTTIYGVCHVECFKPSGSDIPKWKILQPTDVTNWNYKYDADGNLVLDQLVCLLEDNDYHAVYRYYTRDTIETIFAGSDDNYIPPVEDDRLEQLEDGMFRIVQENELGYIPVKTIYQSTKIYNNIGSTVIQDVAQIQRSIYGDNAEIYSAITYGAHPTLVVDENTDQLNDGQVGAEPGAVIRVQAGLTGEPSYVYEFASPELSAITEIRELIDSKIQKLTQIALLRTEDLIKSARSGEQIEVYDDKLAALVRRKAINLENAESKLWDIWYDWTNQTKPEDFGISYNRQYNKKALEHELNELNVAINVLERYESMFDTSPEEFNTPEAAEARAIEMGGSGFHSHAGEDGNPIYMPFTSHAEFERITGKAEDAEFKEEMRDKIRQRLQQLLSATTTTNGF